MLGAFVGLLAGLVGGFVFEVLARVVLLPFLGPALLRAPLLASQLLSDADYVAGVSGKLKADGTRIDCACSSPISRASFGAERRRVDAAP